MIARSRTRSCVSTRARASTTPTVSSSTATATTSVPRMRCVRCGVSCPAPATRPSRSPSAATCISRPRRRARTTCLTSRSPRARIRPRGSSRRLSEACVTDSRAASLTPCASRPSTRKTSLFRWDFPATSSPSPTTSTGRSPRGSAWGPVVVRARGRWLPTP